MSTQFAPLKEHTPGYARRSQALFVAPSKKTRMVEERGTHKLVRFGEMLLDQARQYRDGDLGMKPLWTDHRKRYLGSAGGGSLTYSNLIYETIEKLSADLSDGRPTFQFDPNTPNDLPMTDYLGKAVPWVWDQHDLQSSYYDTLKGNLIFGNWYWKMVHDPRFAIQGAVERVLSIPPWYIFPAPYATNMDEAPWVIEVFPRTVGEIFNDYGINVNAEMSYGAFFPDVGEDLGGTGIEPQFTTVATGGATTGGQIVEGLPDSFLAGTARDGIVLQKELWIRDGSTEETFSFKDDQNGVPRLMRSYGIKFPKGRVISWANGHLLYDVPNPYQDGRFPYTHFKDGTLPSFWHGLGEVPQLINLQLLHNDTQEIMKQIHMFMATGRTIVDKETGLIPERMSNRPGDIWFVRPGTVDRIKHLGAQVPHSEFYSYLNMIENQKDLMSGVLDPSRGINPSGVTAGRALQTLQSAAGIRVKARFNDLERALVGFAKRMASRIQQFWPTETSIRVTGEDKPDDAMFETFRMRPNDRNANYTVRVSSTANLDAVKANDFQKLILLAQSGMPLPPELLFKAANLSNQKEIEAMMARMPPAPPPTQEQASRPSGPQGGPVQ